MACIWLCCTLSLLLVLSCLFFFSRGADSAALCGAWALVVAAVSGNGCGVNCVIYILLRDTYEWSGSEGRRGGRSVCRWRLKGGEVWRVGNLECI
jgi:hypothetical protein